MRAIPARHNPATAVPQHVLMRLLKLQNPSRTSCSTALKRTVNFNCNFSEGERHDDC
jgi:hypothetical protein